MNVWVNYVTFHRDHEWLRYSLRSFRKYASGFSGVMIVVPTEDHSSFKEFEKEFSTPDCPVVVKTFLEYPQKGFVHHLAMKCYADVFSPQADFIVHMDPDTLFSAPVTPDDYIVDGKPVLIIEPYEVLKTTHVGRYHWKSVTEMAVRFETPYETMCRHPAIHPRDTYALTRCWIEVQHETPFIDFVLKQKNKYPQGFGEFNTLGAIAFELMKDRYHFIDRKDQGEAADPPSKVTQMWSYQGTHRNMETIKSILK